MTILHTKKYFILRIHLCLKIFLKKKDRSVTTEIMIFFQLLIPSEETSELMLGHLEDSHPGKLFVTFLEKEGRIGEVVNTDVFMEITTGLLEQCMQINIKTMLNEVFMKYFGSF